MLERVSGLQFDGPRVLFGAVFSTFRRIVSYAIKVGSPTLWRRSHPNRVSIYGYFWGVRQNANRI